MAGAEADRVESRRIDNGHLGKRSDVAVFSKTSDEPDWRGRVGINTSKTLRRSVTNSQSLL